MELHNDWAVIGNVWQVSHITDRKETKIDVSGDTLQHPAPFPTQLSEAMVLSTTLPGDTVLDPFLGSGTTLKVTRHHGRKGIGFETFFEEYEPIIRARIASDDFLPSLLDIKREKTKGRKPRRRKDRSLEEFKIN